MTEILPAIMPQSLNDIERKVTPFVDKARTVQIDIMDGVFTKHATWPYRSDDDSFSLIESEQEGMPFWDDVDYEIDAMVADPQKEFAKLVKIGPTRMVFHIESLSDSIAFFESIEPYYLETIEFGIALNTTTPIETIFPLIDGAYVKFVQCMGIEKIGYQGNPFDERVLTQMNALLEKYPDLIISVDGSVNEDTAERLVNAGASRLVIGSALMNATDPISEFDYFKSL